MECTTETFLGRCKFKILDDGWIHDHRRNMKCRRFGVECSQLKSRINNSRHAKKVKVKVWSLDTCYSAIYMSQIRDQQYRTLQSRKWQLIGMSQWCRSALCGHPLPTLTNNWTHGAASRHTITTQRSTVTLQNYRIILLS